jgi:hypothetical protein
MVDSGMEDTQSVATLINSTTSKIQQLQKAFAELESYRAVTLNLKWKQLEEHFHGLEKSLKRRFNELEDQEKQFENKTAEAQKILENREALVNAKEEASLDELQKKRDAAVCFIFGASANNEEKVSETVAVNNFKTTQISFGNANMEGKLYPELLNLCKEMDYEGLHKYISDNRKNLAALKDEIPTAFNSAADPACLVLDSLKGFYSTDSKKDANLLGLRRTCIMLMECLSILLKKSIFRSISENIKVRAKKIAEEWKLMLNDLDFDASNGNSLEAHAFLQLISTFGINSDFDQTDMLKLIPMVSRRNQVADLCRSLGLSDKMPGVINILINNGRQIDAVNLAFAFELTDQFCPVSLLKSYLAEARKVSSPVKSGNPIDATEREISALKAVIKCIEDHKMEERYPVDPLQKRIQQLEKVKAEKKRSTEVPKPQPKRPRANVILQKNNNNIYARMTDRYQQYVYDSHRQAQPPIQYAYNPPMENRHVAMHIGHGNYFGNGYQYQAAVAGGYIH